MILSTVHRYIFSEWFKVFLLSLGVTTGLLIIHDIYDNLPDFLAFGASFYQIFFYYLLLVPSFLPILIPLALMLSLLFSLGGLHRNNEIIALKAAGLTLGRITCLLSISACALACLLWYLNALWVPTSVENTRHFLHRLALSHEIEKKGELDAGLISPFTYMNAASGQYWVMQSFSQVTYQGFGINIYQYNKNKSIDYELVAKEAYFDEVKKAWVFLNSRLTRFDDKGEPIHSQYFDQLLRDDYHESPVHMLLLNQDPADLSLFELKAIMDQSGHDEPFMRVYRMRYHHIWASPILVLLVAFLSIPLSVSGIRVNPIVNVSKCLGLFFVYFFVNKITAVLGEQGHLPILIAIWLPSVLMLMVASYLCYRETVI